MNQQIITTKDFESYLMPMRIIYYDVYDKLSKLNLEYLNEQTISKLHNSSFNLSTFLSRKRIILHGKERKKFKYLPKVSII